MTVTSKKKLQLFAFSKKNLFICIVFLNQPNMYISSVAITFFSEDDSSLLTTSICLDHSVGCTLLHVVEFINKNPIVKSYLKNKYRIINLTFKYSTL